MFSLLPRIFWFFFHLVAVCGDSFSNVTNDPYTGFDNLIPGKGMVEDPDLIGNFVQDLAEESNIKNMVLIVSSEVLGMLENALIPSPKVIYNIDAFTLNDLNFIYGNQTKSNKQPMYLVSSRNSFAVFTALTLIRMVDHSNTIFAFVQPSMFFYNTYYLKRVGEDRFDLSEICMFCDGGRDVVKIVNSWTRADGFTSNFKPARSFKGSFFGKALRYGCRSE